MQIDCGKPLFRVYFHTAAARALSAVAFTVYFAAICCDFTGFWINGIN